MKKFLFVVLLFAVAAVAVLFLMSTKMDEIVESQIEKKGTEAIGQEVTVDKVNIDYQAGAGEVLGLHIRNPDGFTDEYAFRMDRIRLGLKPLTVNSDPVVLTELIIEEPVATLEILKGTRTNLNDIIAHIRAQKTEKAEVEEDKQIPGLVIQRLKIEGVKLRLRHPKLGEEAKEVVLPTIDLKDIGGKEGVTPAELSLIVVEAIAKAGAREGVVSEIENRAGDLLQKAGTSLLNKMNSGE